MKLSLLAGGLALVALSACSNGVVSPEACANAQTAIAAAEAAIAVYPDQENIPPVLLTALAVAKAEKPILCPAPVTVLVKE